jgi:pyruvate,water dikinase
VNEPRTWLPDPSHYPEQMTPLSASVWFEALGRGLHEAMRELRGPFGGFLTRVEFGWAYEGELQPEWETEPERIREAALALPKRWERELRPRVRAITAELELMRPELPPPGEAAAMLDRLRELVREQWTIHFLVVIPAQIAAEILNERWVELHGDTDPLAAYRLLEGVENAPDAAVRRLAESAAELGVDDLVRELAPEHALSRLRTCAPGRRWLHELDAYLLDFGGRSRWHELSLAREAERPTMTLEAVRLLLERGSFAPPPTERPPVPAELAELYERVRAAYALKELHTYDIDYPGLLGTREALLGFGRRLVAEGLLDATDDVWMLDADELRDAVLDDGLELGSLVARGRADLAEGLRQGPKPYLGEPPATTERHEALEKFYGSGGGALAGAGASPGVAEGTARVVAGIDDFGRVRAGDVLVTTTTTPAWTPLFPSLAALVTETGGILSHAAVVAREYRIPAVVGAPGATSTIPDGARLRVDGTNGRVAILDGARSKDEEPDS